MEDFSAKHLWFWEGFDPHFGTSILHIHSTIPLPVPLCVRPAFRVLHIAAQKHRVHMALEAPQCEAEGLQCRRGTHEGTAMGAENETCFRHGFKDWILTLGMSWWFSGKFSDYDLLITGLGMDYKWVINMHNQRYRYWMVLIPWVKWTINGINGIHWVVVEDWWDVVI